MASIINKFEHTNNLQGTETLALPHWTVPWNGQVESSLQPPEVPTWDKSENKGSG